MKPDPTDLEIAKIMVKLRAYLGAGALALGLLTAAVSLAASSAAETGLTEEKFGTMVRDYLLKHPEVLREVIDALDKKEKAAEKQAAVSVISSRSKEIFRSSDDHVAGNPAGKISVVEFFDYNCGYCRHSLPDVLKLLDKDKEVRLVIKEFPILGAGSVTAAKAALAARRQNKYWDFHLALMRERGTLDDAKVMAVAKTVGLDIPKLKADMESAAVAKIIADNHALAEALSIQGTPAFIIDQTLIPGAPGYDGLVSAVAAVKEAGGCKSC
jgi:protein-disulfide isomerase